MHQVEVLAFLLHGLYHLKNSGTMAIGLPHEIAHGSLRISIGKYNTKEEVDYLLDNLTKIVERLRNMSPLYEEFLKGEKKNNGAI